MPLRINMRAMGNTASKQIKQNVKKTRRYNRVEWGVLKYPPCAVVGGGPGLANRLHILREWKGDIFAINSTAGYLSDQGIPHYLFALDCDPNPWKIGPLTKGAVFASRVHINQFKQFMRRDIRVFDMAEEDNTKGIEGGPTAVCRTPHLMLRMGYSQVHYFGCEGCFHNVSHVTGNDKLAFMNMMVVKVGEVEYLTNAAFVLQNEHMLGVLKKYPQFLVNRSGGLLEAMQKNPDTWEVVAIADDLRSQYNTPEGNIWTVEHQPTNLWTPQAAMGG